MISISVLLENTAENKKFKSTHGLSIYIEVEEKRILLDTGPNSLFFRNAKRMNVSLDKISVLLLSHAHYDHTGGLDRFCKENPSAEILMLYNQDRYYSLRGNKKCFIGLDAKLRNLARITMLTVPVQITQSSWFIPCTVNQYGTPNDNSRLLRRVGKNYLQDDFRHEGIFVIDDKGDLVIFNSCSHQGVINTIESARKFFPNKRVRSYIGGFHFPYWEGQSIRPEDLRNLDEIIEYSKLQSEVTFYTGHCTGDVAFNYLQNALGEDRIKHFATGQTLSV